MTIGERIKQRRQELGLSVDDLAERLSKNRATVYRYESNEIENFPTSILEPLARVLRTSPSFLMGWDDLPSDNSCESFELCHDNEDVFQIVQKLLLLDESDLIRISERIDILLEDEKYKEEKPNASGM